MLATQKDVLKALTEEPRGRVHGNGFIQVDMDEDRRIHIFGDPRIPSQSVNTPIHDHRFGFRSTVLLGRLINITHQPVRRKLTNDGTQFGVWEAFARLHEDTALHQTKHVVNLPRHPAMVEVILPGMGYEMRPAIFHETYTPELTVTVMRKRDRLVDHTPRVLVPINKTADNAFHRYGGENRYACAAVLEDVKDRLTYEILKREQT